MRSTRAQFVVRKKIHRGRGAAMKWGPRRVQYLSALTELYRLIEASLAEPIKQKTVRLQRLSRNLNENHVGTYAVEDLLIGDEVVHLDESTLAELFQLVTRDLPMQHAANC